MPVSGKKCERCQGYRDPTGTNEKVCDCCKCKGCSACQPLTEQDQQKRAQDPRYCTWLCCGGFRSGTPRCTFVHLLFKPKITKCHHCVTKADALSKAIREAAAADAAEATPTPAANTVDGLGALQKFVHERTGVPLPDGWRASLPPNAVDDATQSGDFISPDDRRFRTMESVVSYVRLQQQEPASLAAPVGASSTYATVPSLLPMSSPLGAAGADRGRDLR